MVELFFGRVGQWGISRSFPHAFHAPSTFDFHAPRAYHPPIRRISHLKPPLRSLEKAAQRSVLSFPSASQDATYDPRGELPAPSSLAPRGVEEVPLGAFLLMPGV